MELIIEEISRGHKLIGRHKFATEEVSIGRGYHNDIIISDPHVCAQHLTIKNSGEHWVIKDHNTINGSFLEHSSQKADGHIINSGDIITIGKSQFRFVFPHHPVEASVTLSPFESLINLARNPFILVASIALFTLIVGWSVYINSPSDVHFTQLLMSSINMTLMFALWPGLVALISHLTKHDARILTQLGVCFVFYNLTWVVDFLESLLNFNTSSQFVLTPLFIVLPISIAFCLFWLNCYIGFHMPSKRRAIIAASLTALLFGGSYLNQLSKQPEFSIKPKFNNELMTPNFVFATSSDVDTFIINSDDLFNKVDKKIKEE